MKQKTINEFIVTKEQLKTEQQDLMKRYNRARTTKSKKEIVRQLYILDRKIMEMEK